MSFISRRLKRGARNKSMRGGELFRSDAATARPKPLDAKAVARKKQKAARASRKKNR